MASIINASTNSGIVSSSDGTNILQLQTYNKPALTINASQALTINGSISTANLSTGITSVATPTVSSTGSLVLQSNSTTGLLLDASQNLLFNSGFGSNAIAYGCRAWVNFTSDGAGNPTVRASRNITVTGTGIVGVYNIIFNTPMPDPFYSILGSACVYGFAGAAAVMIVTEYQPNPLYVTRTTLQCMVAISDNSGDALYDPFSCNIAIFR